MDTCICVAESLPCSPETSITLLIGFTPIQNKNFLKIEHLKYFNVSDKSTEHSEKIPTLSWELVNEISEAL